MVGLFPLGRLVDDYRKTHPPCWGVTIVAGRLARVTATRSASRDCAMRLESAFAATMRPENVPS